MSRRTDLPSRRRRLAALGGVLAIGAGVAVGAARSREANEAVAGPEVYEAVEVTVTDLARSERLDGTLQETGTVEVVHRIDGATPGAGTSSTSSTPNSGATTSAAAELPSNLRTEASVTCPAPTDPTTTVPATTAPATTEPVTTDPVTTDPVTTDPVTTDPVTTGDDEATDDDEAADGSCSSDTTEPATGNGGGRTGARPSTGGARGGQSSSTSSSGDERQTVTSVSSVGRAVTAGDVLYTVDGAPVVALTGTVPAWRTLSTGIDDGADVLQLETSLAELGYDPDGEMAIDEHFDRDTAAVVERWQEGLGVEATGEVAIGTVVFVDSPRTVLAASVAVGDEIGDGDVVLTLSGSAHEVLVTVEAEDRELIVPGVEVTVGGQPGVVTRLRSVEQDGAVSVQAVVTPTTPLTDARSGDVVRVDVSAVLVPGALVVPTEALVSRLDGTDAVQVDDGDGTWHFTTVEVLAVSGSKVAVAGELTAGTSVLVPA